MGVRKIVVVGACLILAGCSPDVLQPSRADGVLSTRVCPADAPETCLFFNSPVRLEPREVPVPFRFGRFFPMAESLTFVDSGGKRWVAPRGTLTDGASIPRVFVPIVGQPRSPEFVNAAAIHDAYCGIGNENLPQWRKDEWRSVHRMFYDALRASGTDEIRAKVMFAAVYLAGPRWGEPRGGVQTLPPPRQRQVMQRLKESIEDENPPFAELLIALEELDAEASVEIARSREGRGLESVLSPGNGDGSDGDDGDEDGSDGNDDGSDGDNDGSDGDDDGSDGDDGGSDGEEGGFDGDDGGSDEDGDGSDGDGDGAGGTGDGSGGDPAGAGGTGNNMGVGNGNGDGRGDAVPGEQGNGGQAQESVDLP
ncbi:MULTISPECIES: DUF1353 domain-containing protein [unclassified Rhodosalinus]|uniref:DUF1353 domain-containing protein n=1 Tax=unclassified Rhodosalinus TaxID=2630183 RepID=UPI0035269238